MRHTIQKYWTRWRKLLKINVSSIFSRYTTDREHYLAYYWLELRSRKSTIWFPRSLRVVWGTPCICPAFYPGRTLLKHTWRQKTSYRVLSSVLQPHNSPASQWTGPSWAKDPASPDLRLSQFSALSARWSPSACTRVQPIWSGCLWAWPSCQVCARWYSHSLR